MSWSQEDQFEQIQSLKARLVDLDIKQFVEDEIARRLAERDLVVVEVPIPIEEWDYGPRGQKKVVLSDGRIFRHKRVSSQVGDSWGIDFYEFVEEK